METKNYDVMESIIDICQPSTAILPLEAIWLDKGLITHTGKKFRISEGTELFVNDAGELENNDKEWNAVVTSCHGTVYSTQMYFVVMMKDTMELKRINV